jgi:hypothetical protein
MTVTPTPPRNAIDSPAARTPRKRRRLTVVTAKMPSGIADASSQKEPHWMAQPFCARLGYSFFCGVVREAEGGDEFGASREHEAGVDEGKEQQIWAWVAFY